MTYEYQCPEGHLIEKFFKSFSEAAPEEDKTTCLEHGVTAERIMSTPLAAHLYGDPEGYHKPSPTKRFNTKTVSKKDGNKHSAG